MNRLLLPLSLISMILLAACGQVRSLTPIIEDTELTLQEELEGAWKIGEGIFHIAFEENRGQFAWIEHKDGEFILGKGELHVMRSEQDEDIGFLSLRVLEEDGDQEGYVFAGFKLMEGETIVVWNAGPVERYQSLLDEGTLEGEFKKGRYSSEAIFTDGPALVSKIDEIGNFFELENPAIMTRILSEES